MKQQLGRNQFARKLILAVLGLPLFFAFSVAKTGPGSELSGKISPLLRQEVDFTLRNPQYGYPIPVIVQVRPDFFARNESLQRQRGQSIDNLISGVNGYTARLTGQQIQQILRSPLVEYVTLDAVIHPTYQGKKPTEISYAPITLSAIGADQLHPAKYQGSGVTVAVFDSGVANHPDMDGRSWIKVSKDFTKAGPPKLTDSILGVDMAPSDSGYEEDGTTSEDGYGHGTHVAGIIAGDGLKHEGRYRGVAPQAKLVVLKVVGPEGTGLTSNLIRAIDWTINNKTKYNINVANLALGHAPVESYTQDPLCQAVERMVAAGIVTVVSSGNLGKTSEHPKIWGGITSPGNDPAVITVAPLNTMATATHSDDIATSYGSRGATYVDGLFKPDLCAPGNAIASFLAPGSYIDRYYPELKIDATHAALSGSSMATGYVSGTVALMLSTNPDLTPRLVKAILLASAVKLTQPHMLEQGNGLVNTLTSVEVAKRINLRSRKLRKGVRPFWFLDGEKVWAGGAFAFADRIVFHIPDRPRADRPLGRGKGLVRVHPLVTFAVGRLFDLLPDGILMQGETLGLGVSGLVAKALICSLLYFTLNSFLVAAAVALVSMQSLVVLWKTNFLWASLTNFFNAALAAVSALATAPFDYVFVLAAVPLILCTFYAYRIGLSRARLSLSTT